MHYRAVRETIITDVLDVVEGPFQNISKVNIGDIVRLIGDVKKLPDGILRFEAESIPPGDSDTRDHVSAVQGWVTLLGNKGSTFFHLHTPGYRVVKQTVLTDIFEMKSFKPIVRLNVGDQVRAIGFPRRGPKSGLLRVKATTVGHKKDPQGKEFTGFVTVEGNQNSVYLETCEQLEFPEDEGIKEASGSV